MKDLDGREFVSFNLKFLQILGYFAPKYKANDDKKRKFYKIYQVIIIVFVFTLCVLSQTANVILSFGDMEKITDASFLFLTYVVETTKIYIFITYHSEIWKLIDDMDKNIFKPQNHLQRKMLSRGIKMSKIITVQFLAAVYLVCIFWGLAPLIDKSKSDKLRLPLSGWYPFNIDESPGFELAYVHEIVLNCYNGLVNITIDTFISGTIMVVAAQLSILNDSLENMHINYKRDPIKGRKDIANINRRLIRNIIHHLNILKFADDLTFLFTTCITGMFVVAAVIMCISMFQMSLVPVLSFRFLAMLFYQICVLEEIFLWCYYGNEVILKSDRLTQSAYMCEWTDSHMTFKQNLIYFMTRTQIPLKLYASGYFTLSLETFKAIVKSSWSYFAVLNQVHSQET